MLPRLLLSRQWPRMKTTWESIWTRSAMVDVPTNMLAGKHVYLDMFRVTRDLPSHSNVGLSYTFGDSVAGRRYRVTAVQSLSTPPTYPAIQEALVCPEILRAWVLGQFLVFAEIPCLVWS